MRTTNRSWNDGSRCVRAVQFREAVSTEVCTKPPIIRGALAQLVARNVRIVEVRGSNPLCSTRLPLVRVVFFCEQRGFEGPGVNEAPVEPQSRSRPSPKARIESPMLHHLPLVRVVFFCEQRGFEGSGGCGGVKAPRPTFVVLGQPFSFVRRGDLERYTGAKPYASPEAFKSEPEAVRI